MLKPCLLVTALLLLTGAVAASAQPVTDCSISCSSQSLCTRWCTENGGDSSCGNFGVCDPDPDGDGLDYGVDNCYNAYNPNQADCDGDFRGDVCDAEDGIFVFADSRDCWIRNRLHLWGSDTTLYSEARLVDTSSCNSPDKWVQLSEYKWDCVGQYSEYACCTSVWGSASCNSLAFNSCHY